MARREAPLIDPDKLYKTIAASAQQFIDKAELEDEEIKISITPPLSLKEIVLRNGDELLKKLAELAWTDNP
jgi:hypothetical protein